MEQSWERPAQAAPRREALHRQGREGPGSQEVTRSPVPVCDTRPQGPSRTVERDVAGDSAQCPAEPAAAREEQREQQLHLPRDAAGAELSLS